MNASFWLQVLLWWGHRRKAITVILFHSIYSQKSVCNLVVDWLKLSPYGRCCSAKEKKKPTTYSTSTRKNRQSVPQLQGDAGPLSFIFKCARLHWGQGHQATFPNTANYCFPLGLVYYTQREKKWMQICISIPWGTLKVRSKTSWKMHKEHNTHYGWVPFSRIFLSHLPSEQQL